MRTLRVMAILVVLLSVSVWASELLAAEKRLGDFEIRSEDVPCCDHAFIQALVWSGTDSLMAIEDLAAYCGPILWFSPDEPLLGETEGKDIRLPEPFPFEDAPDRPVTYYMVRNLMVTGDKEIAYQPDPVDRGKSVIDLSSVVAVDLDYFFYYHSESGFGGHAHDVESVQMKVYVWRRPECETCPYVLVITRAIGKAHGILWYDNTLSMDEYTRFPLHILVEEGKHASCTDKNADGYFTPGYDVNRRSNDAWGVRDVLRGGTLFTGSYEGWMTKVRHDQHRVFPPLPADSPFRGRLSENGVYAPDNAIYELRPFPSAEKADHHLVHFIADKGDPNWPSLEGASSFKAVADWSDAESFVKSISISAMYDGDLGITAVFPFFIFKSLEDPLAGGYFCQKVYFKDKDLRDIGWMVHYTPSASRWVDGYLSAGVEWDWYDVHGDSTRASAMRTDVILETGFRLRFNLAHSPFSFLSFLTDFWGVRAGVKNYGAFDIDRLTYAVELGSGTW